MRYSVFIQLSIKYLYKLKNVPYDFEFVSKKVHRTFLQHVHNKEDVSDLRVIYKIYEEHGAMFQIIVYGNDLKEIFEIKEYFEEFVK